MTNRQRCCGDARGTSTLEFIVVLPILLFIMFGAVELSRMAMTYNVVVQAAREGARVAAVTNPFVEGPAKARITAVLAGANLTAAPTNGIVVSCSVGPCTCASTPCTESQVTASVRVDFQTLFPALLPMLSGPLAIQETAVMRWE